MSPTRRLAAIVVADVVGYSRLMEADEAGTLATLKQRRTEILDPTVRAHGGRIVKLMGDGVLLEFASAVNAVKAALELQAKFTEANHPLPEPRHIILRIGINLGDVIGEGSDIYGDGVNIAARLESLAEPGGIVVSATVHDHVTGKLELAFDDLGERTLKNIQKPVRIYRARQQAQITAEPAARDSNIRASIAILPFTNLGDDPAQGYFSDGITEDIITELSRWHMLAVQSRSASFRYRGVAVDVKLVARELNVRYIVEGSVRRMGGRVRITAQLIDTETGNHIWAEKFDREVVDIFTVQDQVVRTIVSTLVGRVQAASAERARRKPPASLAAYECVLQGNALPWNDAAGEAEATRLFAKAIEIDPGYGFAHAMLAIMHYRSWAHNFGDSGAALDQALVLAKRAVELDANESSIISTLGFVYLLQRSHDLALQYIRRAVEINPNNQWTTGDMGIALTYVGQAEEALRWFKRAKEIDPYFDPSWYWSGLGRAYMVLHRYEEAMATFGHLPTRGYMVAALVAGCHARLSDTKRARIFVTECLNAKPDFSIKRFMTKEPFKNPADAAHLAESLMMAGLPE